MRLSLNAAGYDKAVAQFTLKKFLLIVVFLDMAKTSRLIDHDPCLFCKDSEHKVGSPPIHQLNGFQSVSLKLQHIKIHFVMLIPLEFALGFYRTCLMKNS